jgi:hypothetical protein
MTELPAAGVVTGEERVRGLAVASEPLTPTGWAEVPDRSVLVVREDMSVSEIPVGDP